jgi:hypothetical protein
VVVVVAGDADHAHDVADRPDRARTRSPQFFVVECPVEGCARRTLARSGVACRSFDRPASEGANCNAGPVVDTARILGEEAVRVCPALHLEPLP